MFVTKTAKGRYSVTSAKRAAVAIPHVAQHERPAQADDVHGEPLIDGKPAKSWITSDALHQDQSELLGDADDLEVPLLQSGAHRPCRTAPSAGERSHTAARARSALVKTTAHTASSPS